MIYIAVNIKNGKKYVGKTIQKIEDRIKRHLQDSKKYDFPFSRAIRKYGIKNFYIIKIQYLQEELDGMEKYYINFFDSFKNGYNCTLGGDGCIGRKWSDSERRRRTGWKHSKETKNKIRKKAIGRILNALTRKKLSDSHLGNIPWNKNRKGYKLNIKKEWEITSPFGEIFNWSGSLKEFSRVHNLKYKTFHRTYIRQKNGQKRRKTTWQIKRNQRS